VASAHWRAITGETAKPSRAYRIADSKRSSNGSAPKRSDNAIHDDTAPGTVTEPQPSAGIRSCPAKRCGFQASGARPEAFRPCSRSPSQTNANASPPMPFIVGSTTVSAMAVASAASIALPPRASAWTPACAARGCEAATMLRASTGARVG
jgi:hypothetical protein